VALRSVFGGDGLTPGIVACFVISESHAWQEKKIGMFFACAFSQQQRGKKRGKDSRMGFIPLHLYWIQTGPREKKRRGKAPKIRVEQKGGGGGIEGLPCWPSVSLDILRKRKRKRGYGVHRSFGGKEVDKKVSRSLRWFRSFSRSVHGTKKIEKVNYIGGKQEEMMFLGPQRQGK